ncbi:MAG TPA: hypothetical protein VJ201_00890 [Candidatus Babeliales bacterium]|nr:hypothetical protein [Candidatus Babeliales bacterium]
MGIDGGMEKIGDIITHDNYNVPENKNVKGSVPIKNIRTPYLQVEYDFFDYWSPLVETKAKGASLLYLQIIRYINHEETNKHNGWSWVSTKNLMTRCRLSRRAFFYALKVLREHHLISCETKGIPPRNWYTIPNLPPLPKQLRK